MAKEKTAYVCSNCGQESPKWIGKCPSCGQWNTFKEIKVAPSSPKSGGMPGGRGGLTNGYSIQTSAASAGRVLRLRDISNHDDPRIDMHDAELNRVLGGGLVPGSIVLLGGEPGIGKSTLSLQTMLRMPEKRILYVSGEESAHQLKMRANRILRGEESRNVECGMWNENTTAVESGEGSNLIPHSTFHIPHSTFHIPHSTFHKTKKISSSSARTPSRPSSSTSRPSSPNWW